MPGAEAKAPRLRAKAKSAHPSAKTPQPKRTKAQPKRPVAVPVGSPPKEPRPVKWYVVFAAALLVLGTGAFLARSGQPTGWEYSLFMAINGWPEYLYRVFSVITFFGGTIMAMLSVAAAYVLRMYRFALRLAIAVVMGFGGMVLAKHLVGRERPFELLAGVHARAFEPDLGYPSGHATFITILTLMLFPYLPKIVRWLVVVGAILLVGLSRLYLGVHLPLDIVGGVALGACVVAFIHILPKKIQRFLRIN